MQSRGHECNGSSSGARRRRRGRHAHATQQLRGLLSPVTCRACSCCAVQAGQRHARPAAAAAGAGTPRQLPRVLPPAGPAQSQLPALRTGAEPVRTGQAACRRGLARPPLPPPPPGCMSSFLLARLPCVVPCDAHLRAGWPGILQGVDSAGGGVHHLLPQLLAVGLRLGVLPAGPVVRAVVVLCHGGGWPAVLRSCVLLMAHARCPVF